MVRHPSARERASFARRRAKGMPRFILEIGLIRVALPFFGILAPLDYFARHGLQMRLDDVTAIVLAWVPGSLLVGVVCSIAYWILMVRDYAAGKNSD